MMAEYTWQGQFLFLDDCLQGLFILGRLFLRLSGALVDLESKKFFAGDACQNKVTATFHEVSAL